MVSPLQPWHLSVWKFSWTQFTTTDSLFWNTILRWSQWYKSPTVHVISTTTGQYEILIIRLFYSTISLFICEEVLLHCAWLSKPCISVVCYFISQRKVLIFPTRRIMMTPNLIIIPTKYMALEMCIVNLWWMKYETSIQTNIANLSEILLHLH